VIGSMVSLAYYLPVIAAMWMTRSPAVMPAMAGGSPEADDEPAAAGERAPATRGAADVEPAAAAPTGSGARLRQPEVVVVAVVCAVLAVALGIYPDPLFDVARDAGAAITSLV